MTNGSSTPQLVIHKVYVASGRFPVAEFPDFGQANDEARRLCIALHQRTFVMTTTVVYTPIEPDRKTLTAITAEEMEKGIQSLASNEAAAYAPKHIRQAHKNQEENGISDVLNRLREDQSG